MAKQVAVIGLGRFGASMAHTLYRAGHDVLAVDHNATVVRDMMGSVTYPVEGDSTEERFIREVGILNYDVAVVAIGSDIQSSLLTTVLLYSLREDEHRKRLGRQGESSAEESRRPFIIARAQNQLHANALNRLGADKVVQIESEAGQELVHIVTAPYRMRPYIEHYMRLSAEYSVTRVRVPPMVVGRTIRSLRLGRPRDKYGLVTVAIRRDRDVLLNPDEDEVLREDDVLVLAGRTELLERLLEPAESMETEAAR